MGAAAAPTRTTRRSNRRHHNQPDHQQTFNHQEAQHRCVSHNGPKGHPPHITVFVRTPCKPSCHRRLLPEVLRHIMQPIKHTLK